MLWSLLKNPHPDVKASAAWALCPCIQNAKVGRDHKSVHHRIEYRGEWCYPRPPTAFHFFMVRFLPGKKNAELLCQNNFWAIPFPGQFLEVKWNWAKMAELTVFYLAGGIETNTTGTSRGRKMFIPLGWKENYIIATFRSPR